MHTSAGLLRLLSAQALPKTMQILAIIATLYHAACFVVVCNHSNAYFSWFAQAFERTGTAQNLATTGHYCNTVSYSMVCCPVQPHL